MSVVFFVPVLLAGLRSGTVLIAWAVLVIVPLIVGITVMVGPNWVPLPRLPNPQVTMPPASLQPCEAETKMTPAGSVSVSVMLVAVPGPLLINTRLYVRGVPTSNGSGEEVILTKARSALGFTVTCAEPLSVGSASLTAEI